MAIKYPEIKEVIGQGLQEGHLEYIQNTTRTETSKREVEERMNLVYILLQTIESGDVYMCDLQMLFQMLKDLRDLMHGKDRKKLIVAAREGVDKEYVRKLTEFVFYNMDIKIVYLTTERKEPGIDRGKSILPKTTGQQVGQQKESVLLRAGGKSYADLLREVKNSVDVQKIGVDVKQIRKTKSGDLLLEVGKRMADTLQKEIKNKTNVEVAPSRTNNAVVMLPGIDAATTEAEIKQALIAEIGITEDQVRIPSLKLG